MSILPRPADTITPDNLLIGAPTLEFAPKTGAGQFGAFRSLGIIDDAAIAKEIETITLTDAASGTEKLIRELVQSFEARLNVTVFNHEGANMQLLLASSTLVSQAAGNVVIVNEEVRIASPTGFTDLANSFLVSIQSVDPALITSEAIGTQAVGGKAASFGETQGDFAFDYKVNLITDISSYIETLAGVPTERVTDLVAGGAPAAGQIGVIVGGGATSGEITYPAGEAPADGTVITATYQPTFALVEDTDYIIDFVDARIRRAAGGTILQVGRNNGLEQPIFVDYTAADLARNELQPFTQFVFEGKARLRLLTDVGINIDWEIPLVNVRLTDDDFTFNREDFQASALSVTLVEDTASSTGPFGTLRVYEEGASTP